MSAAARAAYALAIAAPSALDAYRTARRLGAYDAALAYANAYDAALAAFDDAVEDAEDARLRAAADRWRAGKAAAALAADADASAESAP